MIHCVCLLVLVYAATHGNIVPQLQASLEAVHGHDSVVIAGTRHFPLLYLSGYIMIAISCPCSLIHVITHDTTRDIVRVHEFRLSSASSMTVARLLLYDGRWRV